MVISGHLETPKQFSQQGLVKQVIDNTLPWKTLQRLVVWIFGENKIIFHASPDLNINIMCRLLSLGPLLKTPCNATSSMTVHLRVITQDVLKSLTFITCLENYIIIVCPETLTSTRKSTLTTYDWINKSFLFQVAM